jgi:hypothetical protein
MFDDIQEHHEFLLMAMGDAGAVEWCCPTCGRRLLIKGLPSDEIVILDAGDNYAFHSVVKGGYFVEQPQSKSE